MDHYTLIHLRQPGNRGHAVRVTLDHGFASPSFDEFAIIGFNVVKVRCATRYHARAGISIDNRLNFPVKYRL